MFAIFDAWFKLLAFMWKYVLLLFFVGIPVEIICDAISASRRSGGRRGYRRKRW